VAGYSGTPLARKLGIASGSRLLVDGAPSGFAIPDLPDAAGSQSPLDLMRVSPKGYEPLLDVAFAHRIRLVASALGGPPQALINRAHAAGVSVAALAGNVAHAVRHKAAGVDFIVAQGTEAGGHTGEIATMVLVPDVVDAVSPTPVVAAGGIATGRQVAAAMALGAEGVWCGSVWLTTEEAETQPVVKQKFLRAGASDTVRSRSLTGKPARMLRSAWTAASESLIRVDSVSSSSSSPGSTPLADRMSPITASRSVCRNCRADKLTATGRGVTPSACQRRICAHTVVTTHSPTGTINPVSSRVEMN